MKRVVITGAAAGLGRALAQAARAEGHMVLGIDVSAQPAEAGDYLRCDLTAPDAPAQIAAAMEGPADLFVHCAGISATGPFQDITPVTHARVIAVNLTAPIALTAHLHAKGLLADQVAFVASLSVFSGYPGAVSYAATKDGIAAFARSLPAPLFGSVICPGPLRTDHAARYAPDNSEKSVARRMAPEVAAQLILRDLGRRRKTILPGTGAKLLAALARVAPGAVEKLLVKTLFEKMDGVRS